jgi:nitroreductase
MATEDPEMTKTAEPLALSPDEVLSTTRAVRWRLDFERPVALDVVVECLRLAVQAPTAAGRESWRWMVVRDPEQRMAVAEIYRSVHDRPAALAAAARAEKVSTRKMYESAVYLADNLHRVPVLVIPCVEGRPDPSMNAAQPAALFASILPAVWSFMLALRSRGLGSCWTCAHLRQEREMAAVLGIPPEYMQVALIPVAYTRGTEFRPARRRPIEDVMYVDRWATDERSAGM